MPRGEKRGRKEAKAVTEVYIPRGSEEAAGLPDGMPVGLQFIPWTVQSSLGVTPLTQDHPPE